ncbi:MAG: TolC family protein, partial [Muribaculaceae bacterium]|nr:TolC family protein [Muribaculaceae bacterium]
MHHYLNLFAAAIMFMPLTVKAQQITPTDTLPLTLDECITIALDKNPTIKVANMEIERVDYSKKETLSQLLPNVNFGGSYNRTLAKQVAYMNIGGFGGFGGGSSDEGGDDAPSSPVPSGRQGIKMGLDNSYSV